MWIAWSAVLLMSFPAAGDLAPAQAKKRRCKGTKQWYDGRCRYPADITKLKAKSTPTKKKRKPWKPAASVDPMKRFHKRYEKMFTASDRATWRARREAMIRKFILPIGTHARIPKAMTAIPMEVFAPAKTREQVYGNHPIPIGYDETISQPALTAAMLKQLDLTPGEHVLELKTASGYQSVLLAAMGMKVTTIETDRALAARLKKIFALFGFKNLKLHAGDFLRYGWPDDGPYDAIIATAAYASMPERVLGQLARGGVFIAPIGRDTQELMIIRRNKDGSYTEHTWMQVRFSMMPGEDQGGVF